MKTILKMILCFLCPLALSCCSRSRGGPPQPKLQAPAPLAPNTSPSPGSGDVHNNPTPLLEAPQPFDELEEDGDPSLEHDGPPLPTSLEDEWDWDDDDEGCENDDTVVLEGLDEKNKLFYPLFLFTKAFLDTMVLPPSCPNPQPSTSNTPT